MMLSGNLLIKRSVSAQLLKVFTAMYHLAPDGREKYINEAGEPVRLRTSLLEAGEREYRLGRFQLSKKVHEQLVEANGHYLFVMYRKNQYGTALIVNHAIHPASKFDIGKGKVAKVHPRDVFDEVVG